MTISYSTILLNQLEQMHFEVLAAVESFVAPEPDCPAVVSDGKEYTQFVYVTDGQGVLRTAYGEIALRPGDCVILLPGTPYELMTEPERPLFSKWCRIRIKYGDQDTFKMLRLPMILRFPSAEAGELIDKIIRCQPHARPSSRLRVKAAALELISLYLEHLPKQEEEANPAQEISKIETVLKFIDDHLADNLTVEELARLIYLHPNYFIVFFKSMMGCSPIQYVNQKRMEKAKQLLLDPACSVSETADRIGLKIYYFSRLFKSHTGVTPSRYRKLALERAADTAELLAAGRGAADD